MNAIQQAYYRARAARLLSMWLAHERNRKHRARAVQALMKLVHRDLARLVEAGQFTTADRVRGGEWERLIGRLADRLLSMPAPAAAEDIARGRWLLLSSQPIAAMTEADWRAIIAFEAQQLPRRRA